jgi:hypothetical protein
MMRFALLMLAVLLAGCVDAQTRQAIQTIQDQAKITQAKADAATKAAQAAADANPAAHPQQAAENVAKGVRSWSALILVLALVACGVFLGLKFTALSPISSIGLPVSLGVLAASFTGAIFIPWLVNPWVELAIAACAIGFGIYEIIINKGKIGSIVTSIESDLKPTIAKVAAATNVVVPPATVMLTPNPTSAAPVKAA